MHDRRARSTRKSGFPIAFSGPLDRADSQVYPYRCRDVFYLTGKMPVLLKQEIGRLKTLFTLPLAI
jgi:hypothetical protein